MRLLCLCGNGEVIPDKPGAPENPLAEEHKPKAEDTSDNARSLGFLLSYGGFRFLDLGDLTWNIEYKLVAPTDKIGPVDVYQVTHHGAGHQQQPGAAQDGEAARGGVEQRAEKGRFARRRSRPSCGGCRTLQAIYQIHRNAAGRRQENADAECIANPDEKCEGEPIRLAVAPDGKTYTVTVGWKGKVRRFETRTAAP